MDLLLARRCAYNAAILSCFTLASQPAQSQAFDAGFAQSTAPGGTFNQPVGVAWDGNGRQYVWEKGGKVWVINNGVRQAEPLIDIGAEVGNWRDHGMLGFALDPDFLGNGRIYVMYTVDRHHLMNSGTANYSATTNEYYAATIMRITRYTAIGPGRDTVDPASRVVLLGETRQTGIPVLHESHSTGSLVFGSDGTLMVSVGDGASYNYVDVGNSPDTYDNAAIADGIIRAAEDVGAMRAQLVDCHNGKVLRIDPNTGNGLPSNPFYDPTAPRSPRSRVWTLGLRNPYRMTLKPGSGSTDPAVGDPGTLFIGDVGWTSWEELNVCDEGGLDLGWPLFEGLWPCTAYMNATAYNMDAPNPGYDGVNCTQRYLSFQNLLKQATLQVINTHPSPCDASASLPATVRTFLHERPAVDWSHGNNSRTGGYLNGAAYSYDLDSPSSPVSGPRFGGYAALAGPFLSTPNLPIAYHNSAFHGDYAGGWIRRFKHDTDGRLVSVHDFASGLGPITWIGAGPDGCISYIKYDANEVRRICYTAAVNLPPVVVATRSAQYGPGPLSVTFNASGSSDPENGQLTYYWNFGNGTSTSPSPTQVFTSPAGEVTSYNVLLTVTDPAGNSATRNFLISVNNTPPVVDITSIPTGALYPVGVDTTYQLQAAVLDAEHSGAELTYAWRTTLYHNTHDHPEPVDASAISSTVISGAGCNGDAFSYKVALTVTDAGGLSATSERMLYPRCQAIAPLAVIDADITAGFGPLLVHLDAGSSFDPGQIIAYRWDFGDGTSSTGVAPQKIFSEPGDHQVTLTVTDNDGLTGRAVRVITVLTHSPPQCLGPSGIVLRELWTGLNGTSVLDLYNSPNFPNSPTSSSSMSSLASPPNAGDNYGARIRGYIIPQTTGTYTFTVTGDDNTVVHLGLNSEPAFKRIICSTPAWTLPNEFAKYPDQTSAPIFLEAGNYYYLEIIHKESSGNDQVSLWWQTPGNSVRTIVPSTVLASWQNCQPSVRLRVNLQGAWSESTGLMEDALRVSGLIPANEPYQMLGFTVVGGGGASVPSSLLNVTGKNAVVDWVLVELRNKLDPSQILATKSALLQRDGDVIGTDGYARLLFNVTPDEYFVAVRHRNHNGVMTQMSKSLGISEAGVDFTRGTEGAYGAGARCVLSNSSYGAWAGNVNSDDRILYTGANNDRDPILELIGGVIPTNTTTGYSRRDVNLDGVIKYTGSGNDRDIILQNIGGVVPTAVRFQQIP
ncbi:MAG: PQQ-dependent sugar dehydrogenase [Flavobacteriales bacterium]|nr:PQQ-dependent sugar dehydrogenase [Flavobacteriales bacterium]